MCCWLDLEVIQAGDSTVPVDFPTIQAAIDDAGTDAGDIIMLVTGRNGR
jgi:hypothetical protein